MASSEELSRFWMEHCGGRDMFCTECGAPMKLDKYWSIMRYSATTGQPDRWKRRGVCKGRFPGPAAVVHRRVTHIIYDHELQSS